MSDEERDNLINTLVTKLCHSSYDDVVGFLENQSREVKNKYEAVLRSDYLLSSLAIRKFRIADIVLESSEVVFQPEDRLRCLYLLSRLANTNYKSAVQSFRSEFGDGFKLLEYYMVGDKPHEWKEIALKARQVANGYKSLDLLLAREIVDEILGMFSNLSADNINDLTIVLELTGDLLAFIEQRDRNPRDGELGIIQEKMVKLAKLCGWLDIEVEKINQEKDLEKYSNFIQQTRFVAMGKLYLLNHKLPVDDPAPVKTELLKYFANEIALLYRGDSIARQHVKLPLKNLTSKTNA